MDGLGISVVGGRGFALARPLMLLLHGDLSANMMTSHALGGWLATSNSTQTTRPVTCKTRLWE